MLFCLYRIHTIQHDASTRNANEREKTFPWTEYSFNFFPFFFLEYKWIHTKAVSLSFLDKIYLW